MVKVTGQKDVVTAYHTYFDTLASMWNANHSFMDRIPPIPEKEKYALLKKLDEGVISSIWEFDQFHERLRDKRRDTTYVNFTGITWLDVVPGASFNKYLSELGKTNEYYKECGAYIEATGGFPSGLYIYYLKNHGNFDYTKVADRLFAAFFILRIEDNMYTKLDRYYEEKEI